MPKINAIWAYIAVEEGPEDEGVVAMKMGDTWAPMLGADEARIESLRPVATRIAEITEKRIILAKFTVREDLEIIGE